MISHQIERDLRWAIESPSLIKGSFPEEPLDQAFLVAPTEVTTGHRVGYYFESLIEHYLRNIRRVKMIACGEPIRKDKKTLGEVDFVFEDRDGVITHWETSVKFYLCLGSQKYGGSHYVGPNSSDSLERKHRRLIDHQLKIGRDAFPEIKKQEIYVKGCIFHHPNESEYVPSPLLSKNHLQGLWIRASEIPMLEGISASFGFMNKPHWLGHPPSFIEASDIIRRLRHHFEGSSRAVLLSTEEGVRVFVMHDAWPDEA